MLEARGRAELTSLRSVQTGVASQFLKRAAHAPRAPALLGGSKGEARNSQQPKYTLRQRANLDGQLSGAWRTLESWLLITMRRFGQKFNG